MNNLPQILKAEELRTLDVSGLMEQLGLAQKALELIHESKETHYTDLITAQNNLLEAQKTTHKLKIQLKELTNNNSKFSERIKIIKTFIKAEK